MRKTRTVYSCDFCGKREDESELIVAGANDVAICADCVRIAQDVIKDWRNHHSPSAMESAQAAAASVREAPARAAAAAGDSEQGLRHE